MIWIRGARWRLAWLAALTLTTAAPAGAQQAPAEPDRAPLTIGPLEIRPRLVFSNVGVDNNVFNEHENPKSDFTATISPDLELTLRPGPLRLTYLSGTDLVYYRTYTSERSTGRRFATRAEFDFPLVKPFAEYAVAHTSARPGSEIDLRVRHHPRTLSGGTRLILASRTTLLLQARRAMVEYDPDIRFRGVELADTLNSTTTSYEGVLGLTLTPLTTVSLAASAESARFERTPIRDSRSYRIAPQISISPFGLLTGTASLGYRHFEGRDPALPSYSGLTAAGSLGMVLADRYRLETTFNRDVRYSFEEALPYYVQTAGRLSLATYLFGGFDVRVLGGRETMAYRAFVGGDDPGRDVVTTYGGGVGYRLAESVQLVVSSEFVDRVSTRDVTREYSNNRIFATLNWGVTR